MPYCPSCGREVPESATFCPQCGAALREPWRSEIGFNWLMSDWRVQRHWLERFAAYVIDYILVGFFTMFLFMVLTFPFLLTDFWGWWSNIVRLPSILDFIYLLYFTLMEGSYGYTFGKGLLGLKVVTTDGLPPSLTKAFVRNLSKVFWPFLLIDVYLGLLSRGDPRQRFLDRVAETTFVGGWDRRGRSFFSPS